MRRSGDRWVCSECGHQLEVDQTLAMQTALSITGDDGPCSAKNMTFAETAVYIRTLELRWMDDQRRIHKLERELQRHAPMPVLEEAAAPPPDWAPGVEKPRLIVEPGPFPIS